MHFGRLNSKRSVRYGDMHLYRIYASGAHAARSTRRTLCTLRTLGASSPPSPPRIGPSDGMPEVSIFLSGRCKSRDYNPPCNKIGDKP